ncbi:hypothetical protein [Actinoplanes sp. URMC 104]|uniref:hypothetical protein n=1 Tax=Actinoplanes sp. URMC 104 TaxID=3423409 RepID=UPI003F1D9949
MRRFLLRIGTLWVGTITLVVGLSVMIGVGSGSGGAFLGSIVLWLFALAGGVALSAPAFLNPPDDDGGIWSFRLPLPLWMFLMMMKLASWIGFHILLGTWMLIFKVWHNHRNNALPTFGNAPGGGAQPFAAQPGGGAWQSGGGPQSFGAQPGGGAWPSGGGPQSFGQPYGSRPFVPQPQVPQPRAAMPQASWQADPTGRYPHRWWDGTRWTDRVANGTFQGVDPLYGPGSAR